MFPQTYFLLLDKNPPAPPYSRCPNHSSEQMFFKRFGLFCLLFQESVGQVGFNPRKSEGIAPTVAMPYRDKFL